MTVALKCLTEGTQLTTSAVTMYTSPANTKTLIKSANVLNTTGGAITLTVYKIASGDTAAAKNTVINTYSIAANSSYQCPELTNAVLEAGDFVQALASANTSLSFTMSGYQST